MSRFMNKNEVEFHSPARAAFIPSSVTILISVSVSNGTLMFHTSIWDFNKFIAVFIKQIWPEPVLKSLQHHRNLLKLLLCLLQVVAQNIVITVQGSLFTLIYLRKMDIIPYVYIHSIIIGRVGYKPVLRFGTIVMLFYFAQSPV